MEPNLHGSIYKYNTNPHISNETVKQKLCFSQCVVLTSYLLTFKHRCRHYNPVLYMTTLMRSQQFTLKWCSIANVSQNFLCVNSVAIYYFMNIIEQSLPDMSKVTQSHTEMLNLLTFYVLYLYLLRINKVILDFICLDLSIFNLQEKAI